MTFAQTLTTIFEILMVIALLWCFLHEDRLIALEKKLFAALRRRRLHVVKTPSKKGASIRVRQ